MMNLKIVPVKQKESHWIRKPHSRFTRVKSNRELDLLSFGLGNAKLSKSIATFSLPAGHSCPFAKECLSKADRITGKLIDGKHCRFRCFAAANECTYPSVRASRWNNYDKLKGAASIEEMAKLIQKSLPKQIMMVRIHVSGDYFNEKYFLAWLNVALNNPLIVFYGYTKATPWIVKYKKFIPPNFRLTASKGGTCDNLIGKYNLKFAEVVFSIDEAKEKGLEIDHDDSHAYGQHHDFALLLHGTQPPGTEASKAWMKLLKAGIGGYGETAISRNVIIERPLVIRVTVRNGKVVLVK
jgi:hypothetical protein